MSAITRLTIGSHDRNSLVAVASIERSPQHHAEPELQMDFLSRLIAGSASSPPKQRVNSPAERLATCKKICAALQQIWRTSRFEDDATTIHIANCLKRLNALLAEESRKAAPHSCLLYVASSQIYIIVAKLSWQDADIVSAGAQFFHIIIHGEVEGVLDSKIFARSLTDLVRKYTSSRDITLDREVEEDLVERLFEVSTKVKLDPDILPAWFYPGRDRSRTRDSVGEARKNQFPLFYLLVEYVHHDGSTGDFARTGLLYLTETASKSKALEQWMIESDLAPQMASGLGALYSRLSRKLPGLSEGEKIPPIIALSDPTTTELGDAESKASIQQDVKAYLSYLAFWQDTLNHCSSSEITDTLLDHFQVLFVQQLLYPSLLESSDVEGGSTASVVTYLFRTLDALEDPALVQRILHYLLAAPENATRQPSRKREKRVSISRRKSMEMLAALVEKTSDLTPVPQLFTLMDLMVMSLKSQNPQTVVATLKLVSVIATKHHKYAAIFKTDATDSRLRLWPMDALSSEMAKLLDLAATINKSTSIDQSYQWMLNDVQVMLEQHSCSSESSPDSETVPLSESEKSLTLSGDCKIFAELMTLFKTFFGNSTAVNLALTEAMMSIMTCKRIAVQGWLLPAHQGTSIVENESPSIFLVLADHIEQIQIWRTQFPEWDELVTLRKVELMEDGSVVPTSADAHSALHKSGWSQGSNARSSSQAHAARSTGSQPSSRPTTPRGRKLPKQSEFGSIDSTLISASPPVRRLASSPLRQMIFPTDSLDEREESSRKLLATSDLSALLQTPVALPYHSVDEIAPKPHVGNLVERIRIADLSGESTPRSGMSEGNNSGAVTPSLGGDGEGWRGRTKTMASLSHVLTNAVILQEFILEIAAVVQVRASLFGEVEVL